MKTIFRQSDGEQRGNLSLDLQTLSAEVVELFSAQVFSPGEFDTESSVCQGFSNILLRHWELCGLMTFLHNGDGRLHEGASYVHPNLDETAARRIGARLAQFVEREEREWQMWLDEEPSPEDEDALEARRLFEQTSLSAGVALPIHARGKLIGALVAVSAFPERLREALTGLRFVAAPIVIALGNARRATAMNEQRAQIERLVEELQQRSTALEQANRELQRVARYRSLFLGRMSHELRTPLTSMLGFTEILLEHENLTDTQRRFCEKIQSSGLQLHASLNQLVDLSRLEAGQTELFLHEFSLREMLRESCAAVARLAQKQKVQLDCLPEGDVGTIVSDEGKLRQVLYNFLAHAIGRTGPEGRVTVCIHRRAETACTIEIHDEGEPLADPEHLFDAIDENSPNERGTNMNELGLVIAHRLVGVLGGTIMFDTNEPRGLTMQLKLPVRPPEN